MKPIFRRNGSKTEAFKFRIVRDLLNFIMEQLVLMKINNCEWLYISFLNYQIAKCNGLNYILDFHIYGFFMGHSLIYFIFCKYFFTVQLFTQHRRLSQFNYIYTFVCKHVRNIYFMNNSLSTFLLVAFYFIIRG